MMVMIRKLFDLLTPGEKLRATLLVALMLVMALLEAVGVASIMPFIAVISNPQLVETNVLLAKIYWFTGVNDIQEFLFFLGVMVFALLVFSLVFKASTTYAQVRFTLMREYSLGRRLIAAYLHQPYVWFLNRHSAELGKTILSEVSNVVHGGLVPTMTLIAQSVVAFALLLLLFLVDPFLALSACAALATCYFIIFRLVKKFLSAIGEERITANRDRFNAVSEVFGAVKDVKVGGLEEVYIGRFASPAGIYAKDNAAAHMVAQLPRFALEALAFGGMLLLVLILMMRGSGSLAKALPIVSVYALAGYRLMPALQQIYASLSQLRFVSPTVDALHKDFANLYKPCLKETVEGKLHLNKFIRLHEIEFAYPNSHQLALRNICLEIPARSSLGLVGATGSGKTTLVDLILGLLEPQRGSFIVDDQIIDDGNCRRWQRAVGYVPQQIYLTDDSMAANIAFGVKPSDIDWDALYRAARIANLHDFVMNDLPAQYYTTVGERGVRLSGGQRQRIGIARALYHRPQILILDEATSALDNLTEQAVMEAINKLNNDITVIIIAHRLSTVRLCDQIVMLDKGEIKGKGTFSQLMEENTTFRAMAMIMA